MKPGLRFNGYCFVLPPSTEWQRSKNEDWETEMNVLSVAVEELGTRVIDGSACMIFRCDDGRIRAVTMAAVSGWMLDRRRPRGNV